MDTSINRFARLALLLVSLFVLSGCGGDGSNSAANRASADAGFYKDWAWFKGTYWIVPPNGIYSTYQIARDNSGDKVFAISGPSKGRAGRLLISTSKRGAGV